MGEHDKILKPFRIFERISRVALPLLIWNVVYLTYVSHYTGLEIDWLSMFRQSPMYHLWFVYMIIGLYLILPLLQAIMCQLARRLDLQCYFLALWFVVTCVPIYYPLPVLALLQQTSLLGYAGYFLIGGVIANFHKRSGHAGVWLLVYTVSVFITALLTWWFSEIAGSVDERAYLYFSPNVFFASLASFILFTRIKVGEGRVALTAGWISDRSFLIFFIHVVVLERVQNQIAILELSMHVVIQTILVSLLTFLICLGLASLIRLLPKSKEIMG